MKPPIHSQKHYTQITLSTATTLATSNVNLLETVASPSAANQVEEGAIVKAMFIELWVIGSVSDQFFTIIFAKYPSETDSATFTEMTNLTTWSNKKNILYTTQGLASNDGIGNPIPVMRQWFKIPKGKQRCGLLDRYRIQVASRGSGTITFCGLAVFKEYT